MSTLGCGKVNVSQCTPTPFLEGRRGPDAMEITVISAYAYCHQEAGIVEPIILSLQSNVYALAILATPPTRQYQYALTTIFPSGATVPDSRS